MGNLSNYVTIQISRTSVGITRAGFGTMLILSYSAAWAERTRTYSDLLAVAADFTVDSPEYLAADACFAQTPKVTRVKIARCALKPTLRYNFTGLQSSASTDYVLEVEGKGVTPTTITFTTPVGDVVVASVANGTDTFTSVAHGMTTGQGPHRLTNAGGALPTGSAVDTNYWIIAPTVDTFKIAATYADAIALTAVNITSDGTGVHTLRRVTNDAIVACLVDRLNSVVGKNYLAAQVPGALETDTFTVTASAAGSWFSIALRDPTQATVKINHADPGTATDLNAIKLVDNDWYALLATQPSDDVLKAAAGWVQTAKKIFVFDTPSNDDILTASDGNNGVGDELKALAYTRTHGAYGRRPAEFRSAALYGKCLPLDPGSETWADKTLVGITADPLSDTHRTNLVARNMNGYEDVAGVGVTFDGKTFDGEFLDTTRFLDWFEDDASKAIFGVKVGSSKISGDPGITKIVTELEGSILRGIDRGGFDPTYSIVQPKQSERSTADKTSRTLNGVKFSATLQGAVHKVNVIGSVSA